MLCFRSTLTKTLRDSLSQQAITFNRYQLFVEESSDSGKSHL